MSLDPYDVYVNARLSAEKYRSCAIDQSPLDKPSFVAAMRVSGYVSFNATRTGHAYRPDERTIWIVVGPTTRSVGDFRKIFDTLKIREDTNVVVITESPFGHPMRGEIANMRRAYAGLHVDEVLWRVFSFEIPMHVANCPHEIAPPAETAAYLSRTYVDPIFKKISKSDPQAIWIGARVGDIIKISYNSFTAGTAIDYRIVVA